MKAITYKHLELFFIFVFLPISFMFPYWKWLKLTLGVLGFLYIIFVLLKVENEKFKIAPNLNWKLFWKVTFFKFLFMATLTMLFVWATNKSALFHLPSSNTKLWIGLLFVYSLFSVYPQELVYRTFFFKRYHNFFANQLAIIFANAVLFSLGHLFFKNGMVILLTFLGGLFFAFTYNKTKSTLLVSIEHAIYGCWLFTVGMGGMLGFPT